MCKTVDVLPYTMRIISLSLQRYRNYDALGAPFAPGVNLIVGENGAGKTNLLEAIYLLATSKSMRGARDVEMIQWESAAAIVSGKVARETQPDLSLEVALAREGGKTLQVNGQTRTRVTDFIGKLQAVSFCAEDVQIIRGEPQKRRRFLDLEISQISPRYCHHLAVYRRVLDQRNRLLRDTRERPARGAPSALDDWTERLCLEGAEITHARARYVADLAELAAPLHERLTSGEVAGIAYLASAPLEEGEPLPSVQGIAEQLVRAASRRAEDERRRGTSLVGPHRDDLEFLIDGQSARRYASQGQQRTLTLSVKLAERQMVQNIAREAPVLLLDDVFSELDEGRREQVLADVAALGQTFVSATEAALVSAAARRDATVYRVADGAVAVPAAVDPSGAEAPR